MTGSMARLSGALFVAGLVGVGAAGQARAADDGYANVFSSIFSAVGVIKPDPPPDIAYRERAPLVLPPQAGLPKPVAGGQRSAAWPQDPDVVRHRKDAEEARAPRVGVGDHAALLNADEMSKGRGQGETIQPDNCRGDNNSRQCLLVSPDELRAEGERFQASNKESSDTITAGQEPERQYLTQPPKGYMKATKTVKATNDGPRRVLDQSNPRAFLMPHKTEDE